VGQHPVPTIRGKNVVLRPPRAGDEADRLAAGRDPELTRLYGGDYHNVRPLTAEGAARWVEGLRQATWEDAAWVIEAGGRAVGTAGLKVQDPEVQQRSARYRIGIFNREYWDRGIGTEATRLVLRFGFEELHLHRIELRVVEYNVRAIRSYEKAGFVKEGMERETVFLDGQWFSDVRMAILEHEYRALRGQWFGAEAEA
jgi:RimJ/RimL family protein N-acetyltransferase